MKSGASESSYIFLQEHYKIPENVIVSHLPQELQQSNKPIKVLWTQHAYDQPHYSNFDFSICNLIVSPSNWCRNQFIKYHHIPEDKIVVISTGVSNQFSYSTKKSKTFIYTSIPYKGLEVLARIIPHIPEATFKIFSAMNLYDIQDDPYRELYEYLKTLPNVIYSPAVDQQELVEHLQDAAFFIHPNIWEETFCVSLAEAMKCGCYPIITDIGAIPEVSNEIATIVPIEGVRTTKGYEVTDSFIQNFVSACKSALYFFENENQYYTEIIQSVSQYANENYDWEKISKIWKEKIDSIQKPVYYCMVNTKQSQNYTHYALDSFFKTTELKSNDKFFLIDNDKTFDSIEKYEDITLIKNSSPKSFAENMNFILKLSLFDKVDFFGLSNDVIFTENWNKNIKIKNSISVPLCNQYVYGDFIKPIMNLEDYIGKDTELNMISKNVVSKSYQIQNNLISFYCFYIPYEISSDVGLFDEQFGIGGGEDVDYRLRALEKGYDTILNNQSYILHFVGKSTWLGGETKEETEKRNSKYYKHLVEKWGSDLIDKVLSHK